MLQARGLVADSTDGGLTGAAGVGHSGSTMTLCHAVSVRPLVPRPAVAIGGGIELILILPV
jgi:hypothetical protein